VTTINDQKLRNQVLVAILSLFFLISQFSCTNDQISYYEGRFIKDWLICGPFPNCEDCSLTNYYHTANCTGFYTDYLTSMGGELSAIPREGDMVKVEKKNIERKWVRYQSETDLIPLNDILDPNDLVVAYAFCQVNSPKATKSILSVGSNDGIQVFLNGLKIHENHPRTGRWLQKDNDFIPVELKAGLNNLLLKIDEGGGDFGFVARFLNYDSTLTAIRTNLDAHKVLTLVVFEDTLKASFGQPFKISTLSRPGTQAKIEIIHEKAGKLAEKLAIPGTEIPFDLSLIPNGFYLARATFPTTDDGIIVSETRSFKGQLKRHPKVKMLDRDLMPISNKGKSFFPIGTYGAPVEDFKKLKDAGYNFVVSAAANLDKVYAVGLMAAVPVHGSKPHWFEEVRDQIEKYKDHPAVLCWMLYDEPGYNRADLLDIYELYKVAYEADPNHPSYLVITNPRVYKTFGYCCDILAVDTYPIAQGDITNVGGNLAKAIREIPDDLPVWHCGQMFAWPAQRRPTVQEHRFMTYVSLIEGAKGLLWYTYKGFGQYLPEDDPELWNYQIQLLAEINELSPLYMGGKKSREIKIVDTIDDIKFRFVKSSIGDYLLVTNQSKTETFSPSFRMPKKISKLISVYGEGRSVEIKNNQLTDTFKPLDVHIYQIR
jgi:hypothetical protein